ADLNEKVKHYLDLLSSTDAEEEPELLEAGRELDRILIEPAERFLDHDKTICVVPDKILNYLPFQALVSPGGTYLVDDYLVEYAPSSTMFLTCTEGAHERAAPDGERFLAVANPSFDRRLFPLANLVDAEHEARTISDFYEGPRLLINGDAREEGVKQEMELANVIHLASHYVVDEQSPMFSKLLLSKEPVAKIGEQEPDGVLEAREIY